MHDCTVIFFLQLLSCPESSILESDWLIASAPAARNFPSEPRVRATSRFPTLATFQAFSGFVQVMENLESHGIEVFQFPGLESHGI